MTENEKQEIVAEVLASLRTNGRTIMQLTPVTTMTSGDYIELNGGRRVEYSVLYDQLYNAAVIAIEANKVETWTAINRIDSQLTSVTSRVTLCEDELSEHGDEIDTVKSAVSALKRQVDINGDGLDTLTSDFGLMHGSLIAVTEQLETLAEVYCTEAEYQAMADAGTLDPGTKYYIYES